MKNNRYLRKALLAEKRKLNRRLKEIHEEKKENKQEMKRLKAWMDTAVFLGPEQFDKLFSETSHEEIMENKDKKLDKFDGIYIVTKRVPPDVTITKFYDFIRDVSPPMSMQLDNFLNLSLVGDDGKAVSFDIGALLLVKRKVLPSKTGTGFHFANVGPGSEEIVVQYEYALSKLGLAVVPKIDQATLNYEGQFRKILSDLAEGKKSA